MLAVQASHLWSQLISTLPPLGRPGLSQSRIPGIMVGHDVSDDLVWPIGSCLQLDAPPSPPVHTNAYHLSIWYGSSWSSSLPLGCDSTYCLV